METFKIHDESPDPDDEDNAAAGYTIEELFEFDIDTLCNLATAKGDEWPAEPPGAPAQKAVTCGSLDDKAQELLAEKDRQIHRLRGALIELLRAGGGARGRRARARSRSVLARHGEGKGAAKGKGSVARSSKEGSAPAAAVSAGAGAAPPATPRGGGRAGPRATEVLLVAEPDAEISEGWASRPGVADAWLGSRREVDGKSTAQPGKSSGKASGKSSGKWVCKPKAEPGKSSGEQKTAQRAGEDPWQSTVATPRRDGRGGDARERRQSRRGRRSHSAAAGVRFSEAADAADTWWPAEKQAETSGTNGRSEWQSWKSWTSPSSEKPSSQTWCEVSQTWQSKEKPAQTWQTWHTPEKVAPAAGQVSAQPWGRFRQQQAVRPAPPSWAHPVPAVPAVRPLKLNVQ